MATSIDKVTITQKDYNFVDKPDADFYCPVNFEILLHPRQTLCCGKHLSKEAFNRLSKERASCPLCKTRYFTTHNDKYFKRKVAELKVFCQYKEQGCKWIGELGSLVEHASSCSMRWWSCVHCALSFDQHKAQCSQALIPCPNNCNEALTFPRCEVEQHRQTCPLELVECKFYGVVCDVKLPRHEMSKHISENGMLHLMDATVHNFKMTAEIQQGLREKDKEIASLQESVRKLECFLHQRAVQEDMSTISQESLESNTEKAESCELLTLLRSIGSTNTEADPLSDVFYSFRRKLNNFAQIQDFWDSDIFVCQGYNFCLRLLPEDTHLSASLCVKEGKSDSKLKWNVHCVVHLQLLNQLGNHDHKSIVRMVWIPRPLPDPSWSLIGEICENTPRILSGSHRPNVTYIKDDALSFHIDIKDCVIRKSKLKVHVCKHMCVHTMYYSAHVQFKHTHGFHNTSPQVNVLCF